MSYFEGGTLLRHFFLIFPLVWGDTLFLFGGGGYYCGIFSVNYLPKKVAPYLKTLDLFISLLPNKMKPNVRGIG